MSYKQLIFSVFILVTGMYITKTLDLPMALDEFARLLYQELQLYRAL